MVERTASSAPARSGRLLKSVTTFVVVGIAFVIVLGLLGVNVAPIIASAGIVGIALGFGAQSLVKDFLTGVFMILEDQYGVGDVIDTGQAIGTVEDVGLRLTKIRDDNGVIWYVPNGVDPAGRQQVAGLGGRGRRWCRCRRAPTWTACRRCCGRPRPSWPRTPDWHPDVLDEPAVVSVESITPEAVQVRVTAAHRATRQGPVTRELRVRVKQALDSAGVWYSRPRSGPRAEG